MSKLAATPAGIWDAVEKLLANGQAPKLTLAPGQEIKRVPKDVGRPRFRDLNNPYAHYKTPTRGYTAPKCLVCRKRLRVDDVEVCGDICRMKALSYFSGKLAALKGRMRVQLTESAAKHLVDQGIARSA